MKEIIMYESNSGLKFDAKEKALKEDTYWNTAQEILKLLPSTEHLSSDFSNGFGYLQCEGLKVENAKRQYLQMTSEYFQQNFTNVNGIVGRYVSDSGSTKAFNELQYKLCSIDKQYRLWGQIYFALNPSKGKDVKLN